jgi:DNA-binding NarL/FixJ family response regulator
MMREGLTVLLERQADLHVVGHASNGHEAIALCRREKPDIVLMDLRMPAMDGITATRILHAEMPETGIIILTFDEQAEVLESAHKAGGRGYLLKECTRKEIVDAVRIVHAGGYYFPASTA